MITLLDDETRGVTSLLASCQPATTSSQLVAGGTPDDETGDPPFNFGRKLKQWAADQNGMNALLLGSYLAAAPAAGTTNNWDPTDGEPGNLAAISRLDIVASAGNVYLTGLTALQIPDEKRILVRNLSSNLVTLAHQNSESVSANQFSGPGEDYILPPGATVDILYYLIQSGPTYWVIRT